MKRTGQEFHDLRVSLGLSQMAAAAIVGVNYINLGKWERRYLAPYPCAARRLLSSWTLTR